MEYPRGRFEKRAKDFNPAPINKNFPEGIYFSKAFLNFSKIFLNFTKTFLNFSKAFLNFSKTFLNFSKTFLRAFTSVSKA